MRQTQAKPQTLAEYFGIDDVNFHLVDPKSFAHVIIDVQREFCDPEYRWFGTQYTDRVAEKIASIQQPFRDAGARTVIVMMRHEHNPDFGGPHKISIHDNDLVVHKNRNSAFTGSNIRDVLEWQGCSRLFVSGFNTDACVRQTVLDGLKIPFKIAVMVDSVGRMGSFGRTEAVKDLQIMRDEGVYMTMSSSALELLKTISMLRNVHTAHQSQQGMHAMCK